MPHKVGPKLDLCYITYESYNNIPNYKRGSWGYKH
ncbi:hypothetical protein GGQ57_004795 [Parabacteroides faecis]|jgi:hypothetical protein|uniref:Uncharacterized protein n=1 Tax=Parabacteroides faecis TaxID=1217282 RepID=A0ABR6KTU7_9BACT|nr:hypothetical protein [Parabacteroides faecis]